MKIYISKLKDSDIYIQECLRDYLKIDDNIEVIRDMSGKPYAAGCDINFSIAHSGEYIVAAVSENPVGIDIEKIRDRDYQKIAERYYNRDEIVEVREKGLTHFYTLWTMKEAYGKLKGNLMNGMKSLKDIQGEGYIINHINSPTGYMMSVISNTNEEIILA